MATCKACQRFFEKYRCSAKTHGECDCPKCQGYCKCGQEPTKEAKMPRLQNKRTETLRLEMVEGNHNKFWQYKKVGNEYVATWGKITALRPQGNKIYSEEEIKKLLKTKLAKGYHVVEA